MTSNTQNILKDILNELKHLRQDVHQNRQHRSATRSPNNNSGHTPGPARKLLNEIAARETILGPCWYHKRHGIATNPNNCPGPTHCSWNQNAEIKKMQEAILRANRKVPPQKRSQAERKTTDTNDKISKNSATTTCTETTYTATATTSRPPNTTISPMPIEIDNWAQQLEIEIDQMEIKPNTAIEPLEEQLGDLSD